MFHVVSWSARFILMAIVTVFPWWYGGAQCQSQWWLVVAGIAVAALTWLASCLSPRRTGACVPLTFVMTAFLLWSVLQLVPLPQFAAQVFSGAQRFVASVKDTAGVAQTEQLWLQPDHYRSVSISPTQTRASLAVLAVAVVTVWSASVLLLQKRWVIAIALTIVIGGVFNGGLGLYQLVNYSDWTLLELPKTKTSFATFVSRNSAPAYYASVTAATMVLMGVVFKVNKRAKRKQYRITYPSSSVLGRIRNRFEDLFIDLNSSAITCLLVLAFMLIITLATFSRGGTLACLAGCVVTLSLTLGSRGSGFVSAVALSGVMLVVVAAVISFLQLDDAIYSRLDSINTSIQSSSDPRWTAWGYTLQALSSYGLFGCGLGTFRFALQPYHLEGPSVWFHHAENMPLEIFLETGLPGIALSGWAVYLVVRQLLVHCHLQKEDLLLSGVIFATCAIGIQALVDFAIILPAVFVPYCLLLGSFLGRSRRIENEKDRLAELGVGEYDHRTLSKLPPHAPTPGKVIANSCVGAVSLICMVIGLPSLAGYSVAESLHRELRLLERGSNEEPNAHYQRMLASRQALQSQADRAAERYNSHAEVSLLLGQIEQQLWRIDATQGIQWGEQLSISQRWELANPQVLSLILRLDDETLKPLQDKIRAHQLGMQLSQDSFARMQWALEGCPQDARAAWGMLVADGRWLSQLEHQALLELLSRVIGNNTQVMVEVAVLAIREGHVERAVPLLKRALAMDWQRMNVQNVAAIARYIDETSLIAILPADAVKQAQVVELLERLAQDPADPIPQAAALASELASHATTLLSDATVRSADDCRFLARLARRHQDLPFEIKMLQQVKIFQESDLLNRFRLIAALAELERNAPANSPGTKGQPKDSDRELISLLKQYRTPDKLLPFISFDPLEQAYLVEQLAALEEDPGFGVGSLAHDLKTSLRARLVGQLQTQRAETVDQARLWSELAKGSGDEMASIKQERDLAEFLAFERRLELAKIWGEQGKLGEAVKELRNLLKQNPPKAVRDECEKQIKNWSNR